MKKEIKIGQDSLITILETEILPAEGEIVHIKIDNLKIRNLKTGSIVLNEISHLPVCKDILIECLIEVKKIVEIDTNEGLLYWKELFALGKAGIWSIELLEIINNTEITYNSTKE